MEIIRADEFIRYYQRIKQRSLKVIRIIPEEQLEFRLQEGDFSLGDLARHIILIERDMYHFNLRGQKSRYQGCGPAYGATLDEILKLYERTMEEMIGLLQDQPPSYFQEKCLTPAGNPIRRGKWLRAMIEHEVHHRGQIYLLLRQLGITVPQIFQLSSEEVIDLSE
jgi:uncharacterized damage-inducible protein DinB